MNGFGIVCIGVAMSDRSATLAFSRAVEWQMARLVVAHYYIKHLTDPSDDPENNYLDPAT
jgi:hypothetical protein